MNSTNRKMRNRFLVLGFVAIVIVSFAARALADDGVKRGDVETDLSEDLKRFDVPTLVLHGDDDQIVPIADSALLSSKIIKNAKLVVYKGAPHGMCTTLKDRVNEELVGFIKS